MGNQQFMTWLRRKMNLLLAGSGLILMGMAVLLNGIKDKQKITSEPSGQATSFFTSSKKVKVNIEGAVEKPGVYEIPNDSRTQDVLITAGGLTAKADRKSLSKTINLSQQVYDGMKIYIPFMAGMAINSGNPVNINAANQVSLEALPGIGPVTANKIILNRPYQNISELVERRLVNKTTFGKIQSMITVK